MHNCRVRRWPALLLAALLQGCAGLPSGPPVPTSPSVAAPVAAPALPAVLAPEADPYEPEPTPTRPDTGLGGEPVSLPPLAERLRLLAVQEWQLWGRGRWHAGSGVTERLRAEPRRRESDAAFGTRVAHYWLAFKPREGGPGKLRYDDGSLLPWSAAFISWLMKSAGASERQFPPAELHWFYIRDALDGAPRSGLEALDAATTPPHVGDVICAPRDAAADTPSGLAQWRALPRAQRSRRWAWHCDLVVDNAPGELGAIGGNVSDSVTWTRAPLREGGLLQPTTERPWTVVLRLGATP